MHPDIFRQLHAARSIELQYDIAADRRTRSATSRRHLHHSVRAQLGWKLVELGLRLVRTTGEPGFRTARAS